VLIQRNGNGKYEVSLKTLIALIAIITFIFELGSSWAAQAYLVGGVRQDVDTNCTKIERLKDDYHEIDKEVVRLTEATKNLTAAIDKLEGKL